MPLTKEEFEVLKSHQYCDNRDCPKYGLVGEGNIKTHSFAVSQGYCNCCKSKPFSMRKGTMFFGLRTPVDKIIRVNAVRCKTINTLYVESRNGKFRKDDARLIRRTLCHSKKSVLHDAQINFTAQVKNYTHTNDGLKIFINPQAALFEQKYQHRTPAMAQNLIDKPITIKELLLARPQIIP